MEDNYVDYSALRSVLESILEQDAYDEGPNYDRSGVMMCWNDIKQNWAGEFECSGIDPDAVDRDMLSDVLDDLPDDLFA